MNKHGMFKKILSLLLCAVIFAGLGLSGVTANAAGKKITDYSVGDIVEFGWYPQSKVTDSSVISQLNAKAGNNKRWTSYNYYSGQFDYYSLYSSTYEDYDAFEDYYNEYYAPYEDETSASDYMRYTDVVIDGNKYRGVVFDSYRPNYPDGTPTAENSYQDDNGYNAGTVYWFKYEPIKWRVLDPATGKVMSETILDTQPFNNTIYSYDGISYSDSTKTYYVNNYEKSDIREWLNKDFYNTAFSASQKNMIVTTKLDNSAWYPGYFPDISQYDSAATKDKIYLLSAQEALNSSYGFGSSFDENDVTKVAQSSDYAQSQGILVYSESGISVWRLRSSTNGSYSTCCVNYIGNTIWTISPECSFHGVRPALNLSSDAEIVQCDISDLDGFDTDNDGSWIEEVFAKVQEFLERFANFFRSLFSWM